MHSQLDGTTSHHFANIEDREPCWINPTDAKTRGIESGDDEASWSEERSSG